MPPNVSSLMDFFKFPEENNPMGSNMANAQVISNDFANIDN